MSISVFLSYPTPHLHAQQQFIDFVSDYLKAQHIEPRTMGRSNFDMEAPLAGIRRLMVGCCGLLSVAFGRSFVPRLISRKGADVTNMVETEIENQWITSPYVQIEPAMAYQLGLPILILRERGVLAEGVLERGVTGLYSPEFDLHRPAQGGEVEWSQIVNQWIGKVRAVYDGRGIPPAII